jgi:2-dehydropantoate 2-reductase
MRMLVIGAGATGGYFGGRLLEAGRDVTFLVRPERAKRLAETGLVIKSEFGDAALPSPPTVVASQLRQHFDVILLSCKSYDLDSAIDALKPAVGANTVIIPLLNGMRHLDVLDEKLGAEHIFGGQCLISARLDPDGRIVHLNDVHSIAFGARSESQKRLVEPIAEFMKGARFEFRASNDILLDMWEKWVFLATMAGINCLTRSALGDIVVAGGADLSVALMEECRAIAAVAGRDPRPAFLARGRERLLMANSPLMASMLGDLERGGRTEADHILGDLLKRRRDVSTPDHSLLRIAYVALKAAEARHKREQPTVRPA